MCLGVPMRIVTRGHDDRATAETLGVQREISLALLATPWPEPGDYVMVHVGYAISRVDQAAAEAAWEEWARLRASHHA